MVEFFRKMEKIVEETYETDLDDWYYDGISGYVRIRGNPYEATIWRALNKLEYIDGITKIELRFAEDLDEDYDILDVHFLELKRRS